MDKVANSDMENPCILGIFAPWGRGKTYFFNRIKKILKDRISNNSNSIKYTIVEFNAWKYQETPALWAYLYKTIYINGTNWKDKLCFYIQHILSSFSWLSFFIYIIVFALSFSLYKLTMHLPLNDSIIN